MKTLTWKDFEKHRPCYDPQEKYGDWSGTIMDLMQHPKIPNSDKIWAFTRKGVVFDVALNEFGYISAVEFYRLITENYHDRVIQAVLDYDESKQCKSDAWRAEEYVWDIISEAPRDTVWPFRKTYEWVPVWNVLGKEMQAKQVQIAIELIKKYKQ